MPLRWPVLQHHGHDDLNVCATDDFTKCARALVYYIDPENEECKNYPNLLFDRNIIDGRGMMRSVLTLAIGNNRDMGDVRSARSTTSTSRRSSCALRWPVLQHHGHGECERLHHRRLHGVRGCAGVLHLS